jgi:uncharacterized protein (TIGR00369 family)
VSTVDNVREQAAEMILTLMPFAAKLGIEIDQASPAEVVGRMAWREDLTTGGGILHGGALMTLADSLGAACAFLNLPAGARTATISSSTNLLGAVREGEVTATSRPLHVGRSVIVVQTEMRDSASKLVAQTTQAQAVLGGP